MKVFCNKHQQFHLQSAGCLYCEPTITTRSTGTTTDSDSISNWVGKVAGEINYLQRNYKSWGSTNDAGLRIDLKSQFEFKLPVAISNYQSDKNQELEDLLKLGYNEIETETGILLYPEFEVIYSLADNTRWEYIYKEDVGIYRCLFYSVINTR